MSRDYSDLQVVPDQSYPEVVPQFGKDPTDKIPVEPPQQATPPKRICGLPPKRFWIVVVAVVLITGAVIGGAVGGTQASKSKSNDDAPSSAATTEADQATTDSTTTSPTSTTVSLSTSTLIGPTQTLYRDCPSSNDTIYEAIGSSHYKFRKRCNVGFAGSPNNVVNMPATSLDDCIDKCATYNENNKTEIASRESNVCNSTQDEDIKLSTQLLFAQAVWGTACQAQQIPPAVPFSTNFNSSFALTPAQIKAAGLSETVASSVNAIVNFDRSNLANGGPRQDDFYTLPPKGPNLRPGQILKVQEVTDPTPFNIASGSSLSRILYTTRDINGTIIPASAYILWPFIPRQFDGEPKDKASAVLWAHGTSGYFADAGPSSFRTLQYDERMPNHLVQAGYAVVAPDYAGLGLGKSWDGITIPHQYFAMPAAGQDTLYAMEAALEAFGERLNGKFAVVGHSQGASVAWSTAELLDSGEKGRFKDLIKGYVGTISFAPMTEILPSAGFATIVAMRVSSIFPDFTLDQWLQPLAIARIKLLTQIQGGASVFQQLFIPEPEDSLVKPDWYKSSYHAQAFEKIGNVGKKAFAGPMLVVQGPQDAFISEKVTNKTVTETCNLYPDHDLEYMVVDELGHTPIITAARLLWMDWLEDRFTGKKVDSGCKRTFVKGWLGSGKHFTGSNSYSQWAGAPEYRYQNAGSI
ncbi:hypothetical protein N0V84_000530 [Fusarium piperis]|uniref:AB hydrolase-1 domain-containing protein n=1 Tax=Fusarium piperis TaxID=1435070 RepID=A0A9W8WMI8_9HYPO|nr:hypothetical protein N0V84_000530 [Fusarium piperis]